MRVVKRAAFVPSHISGFFLPFITKNPERSGSLNCGPCLDRGVITEVTVKRSEKNSVKVIIDGADTEAPTTRTAARLILSKARGRYSVSIRHRCQVPVGAGYGASGGGALGTALALSAALGLKLKREEILRTAHVAEVTCRTGLGDVGAQARGGLVMTLSYGAPPHGRWINITVPENLRVVCATLGGISTRRVLGNRAVIKRIRAAGRRAFQRTMSRPTVREFLSASKYFMEESGLAGDDVVELVETAEKAGAVGASQAMLGRSIFAFCSQTEAKRVTERIRKKYPEAHLFVARIHKHGASLLR